MVPPFLLKSKLRSYGAAIEVIEPQSLRDEMKNTEGVIGHRRKSVPITPFYLLLRGDEPDSLRYARENVE